MVAILFYQPSSRTFSSHQAVVKWLGGMDISLPGMEAYSSAVKGESIPDTVRSFANTTGASAIVMRHPNDASSEIARKFSPIPVVNAGSGSSEHPTQALLDLFTIYDKKGTIDNLKVAFVGDMRFGRTVKSLAWLLAESGQNNQLAFVAHEELQMPEEYLETLPAGTAYKMFSEIEKVLEWADVIYMTRTQKEWFIKHGLQDKLEELGSALMLTREGAETMQTDSIIMHPLPRQEELRYGVDENPRAVYFEQMANGLYMRMALLASIIREEVTPSYVKSLIDKLSEK